MTNLVRSMLASTT